MPRSSETLLSRFIDAWNSGERPDVDDYLARAPDTDRDLLAHDIRTFLDHAPTPDWPEATRAAIGSDPLTRRIAEMPATDGMWPALLPQLRRRSRLRRDELVARLCAALGVAGREAKAARYYHGMEAGTLEPAAVSRRVLDALGAILGVSGDELDEAGAFRGFSPSTPAAAFGRTYGLDADAVEAAPATGPQPAASPAAWDEVDELFRGGR